jgi:hypothetical protein
MPACELLPTCPFFNDEMAKMPISMGYLKNSFCDLDNSLCARYIVYKAMGREKVPANLYPTEVMRANRLISTSR